jgi:tetratricopeptide (TPR) repeat protein
LRQPEYETPPPVRETPSLPLEPLPELPARTSPAAQEEEVIFSRIVRAAVGQLVEIPFRGTGWVYLGELSSRRGISYESRRLDLEGQSFVFRAEAVGTYALKFYRQDFIRDYILNDHVQVIVSDAPDSSGIGLFSPIARGRVIAEPRWPLIDGSAESANVQAQAVAPAASQVQAAPSASSQVQTAQPATQTSPPSPPPSSPPVSQTSPVSQALPDISADPAFVAGSGGLAAEETQYLPALAPDEYLRQAQREYDAGRIETALSILDRFRLDYPSGTDEAWWLYGQLLEANGPSRDIRLALEYYRRLVQEFPQSPRAPEAQRRIAYLERYYFNIR